jgi:transketolase
VGGNRELTSEREAELKDIATRIRVETVKAIGGLGIGHIGGSLSVAEMLSVLYWHEMRIDPARPRWEERDRLVLSKGHAGPALYAALALRGYFPLELLETLNRPGTNLPSHCDRNRTIGIDMTTGSLGQGISAACGMALGCKIKGSPSRIWCIIGDGECHEGQVWEAALFAGHRKLDNLTVLVDYNKQCLDGRIADVCDLGDLTAKFANFGWQAESADGHDIRAITEATASAQCSSGRPSVVVLNTIKGCGVSLWSGRLNNHNIAVSRQDMELALAELESSLSHGPANPRAEQAV